MCCGGPEPSRLQPSNFSALTSLTVQWPPPSSGFGAGPANHGSHGSEGRVERLAKPFEASTWPCGEGLSKTESFPWAGHVARLEPERLCYRVSFWRDFTWWRKRQALINLGFPGLTHPGRFGQPRRWEHLVERFVDFVADLDFGSRDWRIRALSRDFWKTNVSNFLDIHT